MFHSIGALVPARFSFLMLHLIATCTIFTSSRALIGVTVDHNVTVAQQNAEYQEVQTNLYVLLSVSFVCFAVELAGFASGLTLHQVGLHLCCTLLHLAGLASVLAMVLNGWTADAYRYIFALCVLAPALLDSSVVFFHMVVRGKILEFMEVRL